MFNYKNYLQNRFNKPFPKSRPNFMFNSVTGENLELDMFNKELLLACEYDGKNIMNITHLCIKVLEISFIRKNTEIV